MFFGFCSDEQVVVIVDFSIEFASSFSNCFCSSQILFSQNLQVFGFEVRLALLERWSEISMKLRFFVCEWILCVETVFCVCYDEDDYDPHNRSTYGPEYENWGCWFFHAQHKAKGVFSLWRLGSPRLPIWAFISTRTVCLKGSFKKPYRSYAACAE